MKKEKFALCVWLARYIQQRVHSINGIRVPSVYEIITTNNIDMATAINWRDEKYGPTIDANKILIHVGSQRIDVTQELEHIVDINSRVNSFTDIVFLDTASIDVDSALEYADKLSKKLAAILE